MGDANSFSNLKRYLQKARQAFDPADVRAERGNEVFLPEGNPQVMPEAPNIGSKLTPAEAEAQLQEHLRQQELMNQQAMNSENSEELVAQSPGYRRRSR